MDFERLKRKAMDVYVERGGADAAKDDAGELRAILKGDGTMMEKAKRAAKALKEPGAANASNEAHEPTVPTQTEPSQGPPAPPTGT